MRLSGGATTRGAAGSHARRPEAARADAAAYGGAMANRLAGSSSPYLLQHADNPVDWWEWGDEAFAEARRRDVPVLLSVGYAACHWCHVMAHESFEDDEVAAAVNAHFVTVKVDREERPDVDAVYMEATTALTGHGGWPMTCLLTPDGDPFFAGTYLPKHAVARAAGRRRRGLGDRSATGCSRRARTSPQRCASTPARPRPTALDAGVCDTAARQLRSTFDEARGGFGGAPKFPPSMVLEFLLRHHARTGSADALAMVARHLRGDGARRHLRPAGGGFARYSVDADWVVPHFEKMLYDNALLLRRLPALVARDRRPLGPAGGRGDRRVPAARPAHRRGRLRVAPWTPTRATGVTRA